ncbi:MAG: biotin/lipoyl-binding protein, partial [Christensenellales bacterium]
MSRRNNIRAACAMLLMLLLPAAGAVGVRYATSAVTRGSFKRTAVVNGAILRLETQTVAAQAHGARLGNVYVAVGDAVEPGDLLASYVLPVSATAIKQAEIAWRTAVEDAAYETNAHEAWIAELRALLEAETDETAAEILSLQIE